MELRTVVKLFYPRHVWADKDGSIGAVPSV